MSSAGLWPLALVIFTASIAIPLLKLIGLTWLIWSARHGSARRLVLKTRLYRVIKEIGRWSNIDVFTIAIFLPLMQFSGLVSVRAATGAPAFLAVIVLTMLAVRVFDPRLIWDPVAIMNEQVPEAVEHHSRWPGWIWSVPIAALARSSPIWCSSSSPSAVRRSP